LAHNLISDIIVPYPDAAGYHLILKLNGIQLKVTPFFGENWVEGLSRYKRPPEPTIQQVGGEVTIAQEAISSELTKMFRVASDSPLMELAISQKYRFRLSVDSFSDTTTLDLGGLPLTEFTFAHKLGPATLDFSSPNPQIMQQLTLDTHAAHLEVHHLLNANFARMTISGHTGTFKLYFEGKLHQDQFIEMKAKESPTTLFIPTQLPVKVQAVEGELDTANIEFSADDAFIKYNGGYWTENAINGTSPSITITVTPLGPLALHSL
jgi:hypothetical protein